MRAKRPLRHVGFTLVEIAVVGAIVSVLALILFAVLARVNEKGRSAVCQNNLKQIALGAQQYVQDNGAQYPLEAGWQLALLPYVKETQLFMCPSKSPSEDSFPASSYRYNFVRLMQVANGKGQGRHESTLPNAAAIYLNSDIVLNDGYGVAPGSCNNSTGVNLLHSGGSNFSFLDGHVKWLNPQQYADIECSLGKADVNAP